MHTINVKRDGGTRRYAFILRDPCIPLSILQGLSQEKGFLSLISIFTKRPLTATIARSFYVMRMIMSILFFRKTLLTIRSINNSFRSLLALRELKTIQVCASRATSIRRNEEKSPVKVHGSSQTFHFDFPRAPLSFIKIDALKAVRDWGSRSSRALP